MVVGDTLKTILVSGSLGELQLCPTFPARCDIALSPPPLLLFFLFYCSVWACGARPWENPVPRRLSFLLSLLVTPVFLLPFFFPSFFSFKV